MLGCQGLRLEAMRQRTMAMEGHQDAESRVDGWLQSTCLVSGLLAPGGRPLRKRHKGLEAPEAAGMEHDAWVYHVSGAEQRQWEAWASFRG